MCVEQVRVVFWIFEGAKQCVKSKANETHQYIHWLALFCTHTHRHTQHHHQSDRHTTGFLFLFAALEKCRRWSGMKKLVIRTVALLLLSLSLSLSLSPPSATEIKLCICRLAAGRAHRRKQAGRQAIDCSGVCLLSDLGSKYFPLAVQSTFKVELCAGRELDWLPSTLLVRSPPINNRLSMAAWIGVYTQ